MSSKKKRARGVTPRIKRKSSSKVRNTHVKSKRRSGVSVNRKTGRALVKKRRADSNNSRVVSKKKRAPLGRRQGTAKRARAGSKRAAVRKPLRISAGWNSIFKLPGLTTIVDHSGDTNGRPLKRRERQFSSDRDDRSRPARKSAANRAKAKRKRKVPASARKRRAIKTKR